MKYNFNINILNRNNILLNKKINYIKLFNNGLEIYYNHIPILLTINNSIILIIDFNNIKKFFYVFDCILEFYNNKLYLLTDKLITFKNLNKKYIINKKKKIENKLFLLKENNIYTIKYFQLINKLNIYIDYLNLIKFTNNY